VYVVILRQLKIRVILALVVVQNILMQIVPAAVNVSLHHRDVSTYTCAVIDYLII